MGEQEEMKSGGRDRSALVDRLRQVRDARSKSPSKPGPGAKRGLKDGPASFDFSTLPAYEQIRFTQAAGHMLGVPAPFFRSIDSRDGAVCVMEGRERIVSGHPPRLRCM